MTLNGTMLGTILDAAGARGGQIATLDTLARETGMSREQLVSRLSAELPQAVDKLTPQGRVPAAHEVSTPA